ncbi:MAG: transposase [Rhizomicrobium sp.]|jgi:putative transposase
MARLARVVMPGVPHHMTQRGNRGQQVFFGNEDYTIYKTLLAEGCREARVAVWAYCLMPTHVHLILRPGNEDGLRTALGEAHRRYTRHVNLREGWRGYLWQGRFSSFPMDEEHVLRCARYVELNPVQTKLVRQPRDWRWSSARAHLAGRDDGLVQVAPLLALAHNWKAFLSRPLASDEIEEIRSRERTGRPLGAARFVSRLEKKLGRILAPQKRGPKPR